MDMPRPRRHAGGRESDKVDVFYRFKVDWGPGAANHCVDVAWFNTGLRLGKRFELACTPPITLHLPTNFGDQQSK
jgi:hypothetical protein